MAQLSRAPTFGEPGRRHDQRPSYSLFLKQSELDRLLSDQPAQKRSLPELKIPDLVAAMRTHADLNRARQREALRKSPEFERYHITDDRFREAEKQVPRRPRSQANSS